MLLLESLLHLAGTQRCLTERRRLLLCMLLLLRMLGKYVPTEAIAYEGDW